MSRGGMAHRDEVFLSGEVDPRMDVFHERLPLPNGTERKTTAVQVM